MNGKKETGYERVFEMPIKEFCKTGSVLVVESELLGETVTFVSNRITYLKRKKEIFGVAYFGEELLELLDMTAGQIKDVHMVKKVMGGVLLGRDIKERCAGESLKGLKDRAWGRSMEPRRTGQLNLL